MMKKIILMIISVFTAAIVIIAVCGSLFEQTISEKKIDAFLTDSQDAFRSLLSQDGDDSDLKIRAAAAAYASRKKYDLPQVDNGFLIEAGDIKQEISDLYFEDDPAVSAVNGDFLFNPVDTESGQRIFEITDAFYGLVGSEPTTLTVRYTYHDRECEVEYTLIGGQKNTYTFRISDMTVQR